MNFERNKIRKGRHTKIRKNVIGTPEKPRLVVYKRLKNIYSQIVDDTRASTLASSNTIEKAIKITMCVVETN